MLSLSTKVLATLFLTLVAVLVLYPLSLWLFGKCYELKARGSWWFYLAAALMAPCDVLFNLTWGVLLFEWELPHELTFSGRVRRHLKHDNPMASLYLEAAYWRTVLNERWPEHIG